MMNDPLLPPPPPLTTGTRISASTTKRARRPGPATSAKILATGLATTAMLGLTTGYALAKNAQPAEITPTTDGDGVAANVNTAINSASQPETPSVATPSPESASPAVSNQPVVEVPVPDIAPAQPGNNWNAGNNQPSSGSN